MSPISVVQDPNVSWLAAQHPAEPGRAPRKRIGLLSLISPECDTVPDMAAKARRYHQEAMQTLEELGFDVVRPAGPTRTPSEAVGHVRGLEERGAEALVFYVADWSFSTTAAIGALLSNPHPIVLWTNARTDCAGLIGMAITKGALDEVGITSTSVYGDFDDPATREELRALLTGRAAAARLRGMRYGLGGTRSLDMLTAVVDPNQWLTQFGIDIDGWDEVDVVERAKAIPAAELERHVRWLRRDFGGIYVPELVVESSFRLYLALKQVAAEKQFDFISVKCMPEMPAIFTSFCLAHALLGDASDADGPKERMICACEADSNGALTMQLMKNVDDQAINFADVRWMDPVENVVRISNCGSQATELAASRADVRWVEHGLKEHPWKYGGMAAQAISKPGRVTMARLSRIKGRYVMFIAGGESLDVPREALDSTGWSFSPHSFIRVDAPAKAFVRELRSNHLHHMYGDWRRELVEACAVLGIEPVLAVGEPPLPV